MNIVIRNYFLKSLLKEQMLRLQGRLWNVPYSEYGLDQKHILITISLHSPMYATMYTYRDTYTPLQQNSHQTMFTMTMNNASWYFCCKSKQSQNPFKLFHNHWWVTTLSILCTKLFAEKSSHLKYKLRRGKKLLKIMYDFYFTYLLV